MQRFLLAAFLLASVSWCEAAMPAKNQWAVLIAGSNEYYNYRHQSDICHAYHVLINRGFDPEHIITFSFDDVASSSANLYPNQLYNAMDLKVDYNKGCKLDYTKNEVTPENFLAVIKGETPIAGKRTLKSGENDHVFISFVDHGGPNILGFPEDQELERVDFLKAIKAMGEMKMYKKLLFFIEACYSGSMFYKGISENSNILAITAANTDESSYACYFCEHLDVYLGDLFSVKWMELADSQDMTKYGFSKIYSTLKKEVDKSHVSIYGELKEFHELTMADFIGPSETEKSIPAAKYRDCKEELTPSFEVQTALLTKAYLRHVADDSKRQAAMDKLFENLQLRQEAKKMSNNLVADLLKGNLTHVAHAQGSAFLTDDICYKKTLVAFRKNCPKYRYVPESIGALSVLKNACTEPRFTSTIIDVISRLC